ncbi:MAG: LPS-assembly protein LptD, partial [Synergistaceae bacterium]|nr:LPS-assembly protein LptD [Synergistaceae bacterium]
MAKTFKRVRRIILSLAVLLLLNQNHNSYAAVYENYYVEESSEIVNEENLPPAPQPDNVTLNADRVSFNDETGYATAQGNATLKYKDTTIEAERIEYNADTQKVQAMPLPNEKVTIKHTNRILRGDILDYDLTTGEGILTGPATRVALGEDRGVLYVSGGEIDVIPWELAEERGLVKGSPEDYLVQWRQVSLTTCALDHPHYRLESKTISFIPGRRVIAKKPRIYLGNTYLFTSPLDYVVSLKRKAATYSFIPYFQRNDTRGTGGGITGTIGWETGSLSVGLIYMSEAGLETMFEIEQELNDDFSIQIGVEHTWDELWDERVWRPYASLNYSHNGWDAALRWTKNEYISDRKDSLNKFKGRLDRRPEFTVWAPWIKTSQSSWLRLRADFGSYLETLHGSDNENITSRYGMGFRHYFERPLNHVGTFDFFSSTEGSLWFYDREDADHEMLRSFTGLRYKIGAFEFGTGYERQYVWGESPMQWDLYRDRQRVHQKVRFPLGREVYTSVRGSYDLDESMIDEVTYTLQW